MNDTQWPRFQVFLQEKENAPYQDVGSVHAPDAEMALMNARDVFVRRPACFGLWIVPADAIYSRTAQELENAGPGEARASGNPETYWVFTKSRSAGTQTRTGQVQASSPQEAMQLAISKYSSDRPPFAWWVFPDRIVRRSEPGEIESLFAPAQEKHFRMSTDFRTHTAMRQLSKDQE